MIAPKTQKKRSQQVVRSGREAEPALAQIKPMLATLSAMPKDEAAWEFEFKWDGVRAITYIRSSGLHIESRNLIDVTLRYPELHSLVDALGDDADEGVIIDGEIVALDENYMPSFSLLQSRMHVQSKEKAAALANKTPVVLMAFDLLMYRGRLLIDEAYTTRRELLQSLELSSEHWQTPMHERGQGSAMLDAARQLGLEGVIAKRPESTYQPGVRSPDWRKIKVTGRQAFIIVGYQAGSGSMAGSLGALLLGYYESSLPGAALRYAGKVGTGFTDTQRAQLLSQLQMLRVEASPLTRGAGVPRGSQLVQPVLVADVEYRGWTDSERLRQPSFKGLRSDKPASSITRQQAIDTP